MTKPILYTYATSSCSFRVRIALNLKGIDYESRAVASDEQAQQEYRSLNPQGLYPTLVEGQNRITQSTAIIEYIEELFPTGHSLLPKDPVERARARAIAQYVVCEIQPLQNTRVDSFLKTSGVTILAWKQHWIKEGLEHLEKVLDSQDTGRFCQGDSATIADCCLVPQVYNACHRYDISLEPYPVLKGVYDRCLELAAVQKAWPDKQPDFRSSPRNAHALQP